MRLGVVVAAALCIAWMCGCEDSQPAKKAAPAELTKSEQLSLAKSVPNDFAVEVTIDERPMTGVDLEFKVRRDGTSEISSSETRTLSMGRPVILPAKQLTRLATETRMVRLVNQFGALRFLELKDVDLQGECPESSKEELKPKVTVTLRVDGTTHSVTHDHACRDPKTEETRKAFQGLEQSLRDVADVSGVLNELFRSARSVESVPD